MPAKAAPGKWTERLRLIRFTAFMDTEFEFVPGVNVLVGENGTGKTHAMKALYAVLSAQARRSRELLLALVDLFQVQDARELIKLRAPADARAEIEVKYGGREWTYAVRPIN